MHVRIKFFLPRKQMKVKYVIQKSGVLEQLGRFFLKKKNLSKS